jgi:hypothetical protein
VSCRFRRTASPDADSLSSGVGSTLECASHEQGRAS